MKIGLKLTQLREAQAEIVFGDKHGLVSPFLGKHNLSVLPSDVARFCDHILSTKMADIPLQHVNGSRGVEKGNWDGVELEVVLGLG